MVPVQDDIESVHLEFKRQLNDGLEKEVIAFLNARDGGAIIIGIDNSAKVIGAAEPVAPQATMQAIPQTEIILKYCQQPQTRSDIQDHIQLKNRDHFRKNILAPLIDAGLLLLTLPDKPTSPKQQFVTAKGVFDNKGLNDEL